MISCYAKSDDIIKVCFYDIGSEFNISQTPDDLLRLANNLNLEYRAITQQQYDCIVSEFSNAKRGKILETRTAVFT